MKSAVEEWIESYSREIPEEFAVNANGDLCVKLENEKDIRLCNFFFKPVELIMTINEYGELSKYKYVFEGIIGSEQKLRKIEVLCAEIKSYKWIADWDSSCIIYGQERINYKLLRQLISQFEHRNIQQTIEYDSIGWQYYEGKWFYVCSDRVIGNVPFKVRTTSKGFTLKTEPNLDAKEAFIETMKILDICDPKVTYSLLGYLLTSIITTPLLKTKKLTPNYLLWLVGDTGTGKTAFSTFFTNIFERRNLLRPEAKKNSILYPGLEDHKDCVMIIDDFGTSKTRTTENRVLEKVEEIIRASTDRHLVENNKLLGMVLITGEKFFHPIPQNESTIKRIIRVKMDNLFNPELKNTYDENKSIKFKKYVDSNFISTNISFYLDWLCDKLNSNFENTYTKDFNLLRVDLADKIYAHGRYIDAFAHQITAFNFFLSYGSEKGFISAEESRQFKDKVEKAFSKLLEDQSTTIFESSIQLLFDSLGALIADHKIIVRENLKELDFDKHVCGLITMKNERILKLHWEEAYSLVSTYIHQENKGRYLPGKNSIGKLLKEYDLIRYSGSSVTSQIIIPGNMEKLNIRAVELKIEKIPQLSEAIDKQLSEIPSFKERLISKLGANKA